MSDQPDDMTPIVLPIGHYMGPVHPDRGAAPAHHAVRIGWEEARLSADQLAVWTLSHGIPSEAGDRPWTRESVLTSAGPDAGDLLDDLLDDGLVVEVRPDDPASAATFARAHRLESLLVGLGRELVGVPGLAVALAARPRVFEVWQWAHLWPDLDSAARELAPSAGSDPAGSLPATLRAAQTLVMHGAAYLDVRRSPAPVPATR